ncbi:MAG: hypothetical protein HQ525_06460 [Anaerolineae bacterium]|nr:hypothetical protein [Anaerolineae bacterium]
MASPVGPQPLLTNQRLHILDGKGGGYAGTHSVTLSFDRPLDPKKLESCLIEMLMQRDALRIDMLELDAGQQFQDYWRLDLKIMKSSAVIRDKNTLTKFPGEVTRHSLPNTPTLQVRYQQQGERKALLTLETNACFCDIWSMDLLIEELAGKYKGSSDANKIKPPSGFIRFQNFIDQARAKQGDEISGDADQPDPLRVFWHAQHDRYMRRRNMAFPTASNAGSGQSMISKTRRIPSKLLQEIRQKATAQQVSPFSVMTALSVATFETMEPDPNRLFVATMAGQPFSNQAELIGQCSNLVPLVDCYWSNDPMAQFVGMVQGALTAGYERQDSCHLFWDKCSAHHLSGDVVQLTHIKRLNRSQMNFGFDIQDYWFNETQSSCFSQQLTFTEDSDWIDINFHANNGHLKEEKINSILDAIFGSFATYAEQIEKGDEENSQRTG